MIKICFVLYSSVIFALSTSVYAVEVKDLYQAKVPVSSQALNQRNIALKKAMQAVLVKVGGQKSVLKNSFIRKAVNKPSFYLSQYSYSRKKTQKFPLLSTDLVSATQQKNNETLVLLASFDENKINNLLQQAKLPLWGRLRPQVLLWLIEEDNLSRRILSESSYSNYPFVVSNSAQERGLPLIMPLMDFIDNTNIEVSDLWGRFSIPVENASKRYSADTIVVMRISNSSLLAGLESDEDCRPLCATDMEKYFTLDWTLFASNELSASEQQYQGTNSELLLAEALSDITDIIYQGYALSSYSGDEFLIDVANIDSMTAYVALTDFLTELSSVSSMVLVSIEGNNRRFKLKLLGSKKTLLASLKLDNKLQQFIDPLAEVIPDAIPVFYWGKP